MLEKITYIYSFRKIKHIYHKRQICINEKEKKKTKKKNTYRKKNLLKVKQDVNLNFLCM